MNVKINTMKKQFFYFSFYVDWGVTCGLQMT